jgi:Haspin like kinase domain
VATALRPRKQIQAFHRTSTGTTLNLTLHHPVLHIMSQPNKAFRTYGSKPRKVTSTQLWDGTKDVPRRAVLGENISDTNERKSNSAIGGFMKGVVEWLSPRKTRNSAARKGSARSTRSGKENQLARETRFSLSDEDDEAEVEEADLSIASTATSTLVSSTPKKENGKEAEISVEKKQGIDLLLEFCSVNEVVDFVEHIQGLLESATISKLGEASYSEVFTLTHSDGTTTVLKVIPFNGTDENDPSMSNLQDLLQEIRISTAMAKVEGFADFQGYHHLLFQFTYNSATIVQGTYPEPLLSSWDTYKTTHKSENDRPSKFLSTQTYCILHLAHHGNDLESHSITEWSEAAHIFWSVVRTLSRGEEAQEFEHRDLHWGNILIDQSDEDAMMERLLENLNLNGGGGASEVVLDGGWGGVKVTVIDYTLSRAKVDDVVGEIAHYGFEDETLFEGKRIPK